MRTLLALVLDNQQLLAADRPRTRTALWSSQHARCPRRAKRSAHQRRHLRVLAHQQARQHLDLRHLRAQPREGLRQLAADRAAAQHHQPLGALAQLPDVVGGQQPTCARPGIGGTNGRAPAAITMARVRERLLAAVVVGDFHLPRATRCAPCPASTRRRVRCSARPSRAARCRGRPAAPAPSPRAKSNSALPPSACRTRVARAVREELAERISAFEGTQPVLRQSPPMRCFSTSVTLAFTAAAM